MKINTNDIKHTLDMIDRYALPEIKERLLNQMLRQVNELKSTLSVSVPPKITLGDSWGTIEPIIEHIYIKEKSGMIDFGEVISVDKNEITFKKIRVVRIEDLKDYAMTLSEKMLNYILDYENENGYIQYMEGPNKEERSKILDDITQHLYDKNNTVKIDWLIDAITNEKIHNIRWTPCYL